MCDVPEKKPAKVVGEDRPARQHKEPQKGSGNASKENIECRQKKLDEKSEETPADPNDPNKENGPQKEADHDDPNKPAETSAGVPLPPDGQNTRERLIKQMDEDYANKDQFQGGIGRGPAVDAAARNLGYNPGAGTPWCAIYANSALKDSGAGYAKSMGSQAGACFKSVNPADARPGDMLIFDGHTALVYDTKPNGDIILQGGNQGRNGGGVSRATLKASNNYQYGTQSLRKVVNPHDANQDFKGDCKPGGNANDGDTKRPPIGKDCPAGEDPKPDNAAATSEQNPAGDPNFDNPPAPAQDPNAP